MSGVKSGSGRSKLRLAFFWIGLLIAGVAWLLGSVAAADGWLDWWLNGGRYPVYFAGLNWILGVYAWGLALAGFFAVGLLLRLSRWQRAVSVASILTAIFILHALVGLMVQSAYYSADETIDKLVFVAAMTIAIFVSILPMCSIWLDWPRRKPI